MASKYKCQCGASERDDPHPYECESCAICGSKILANGEEYDTPLEHVPVQRTIEAIGTFTECKRCRNKLN